MRAYNAIASVCDFAVGVGIALAIYGMLRTSLRELLNNVIKLPEGTTFYVRTLALVLLFVPLEKAITGIHMKPDAHFMEYVWAVASDMSGIFENLAVSLLVYLGMVTVLVAVLRPKNGK
jgi:hypothetical protein